MTAIKGLVCSVFLFLVALGSCSIEEYIEPSNFALHGPGDSIIRAKSDFSSIAQALELYRIDNFSHPSTDQGLKALLEKPTVEPEPSNWTDSGYLYALRKDPWGQEYLYVETNGQFSIYSAGKNGINEFQLGDDVIRGDKDYSCESYGVNCPRTSIELAKLASLFFLSVGFISTVVLSVFISLGWLLRRCRKA